MPMAAAGKPPNMPLDVKRIGARAGLDLADVSPKGAFDLCATRRLGTRFLTRSATGRRGLNHRTRCLPVAVPVARLLGDAGRLQRLRREAMMHGQRTPLAALEHPSGRMAVGESITTLLAAPIEPNGELICICMAACGEPG